MLVSGEGSVLFKTANFTITDDTQTEALLETRPNGRKICDRHGDFEVSMFAPLTTEKEIYRPTANNAPRYRNANTTS